jgi:protein transport protein SEC9
MMKKFGQKKEHSGDGDDANRSALFGRRNPKPTDTTASKNPYANQPASDPYAKANQDVGYGKPPPYNDGGQTDRYRQEKSPVPPGGYGSGRGEQRGGYGGSGREEQRGGYGGPSHDGQRGGYSGSGSYGGQGGYGADRYGSEPTSQRHGGYGGMGRNTSRDTGNTEVGRNELFGNAAQRHEQRQQQQGDYRAGYTDGGQQSGLGGSGVNDGYGTYQDRELTAEEAEEEDVKATKVS